jgi:hypothetical protein
VNPSTSFVIADPLGALLTKSDREVRLPSLASFDVRLLTIDAAFVEGGEADDWIVLRLFSDEDEQLSVVIGEIAAFAGKGIVVRLDNEFGFCRSSSTDFCTTTFTKVREGTAICKCIALESVGDCPILLLATEKDSTVRVFTALLDEGTPSRSSTAVKINKHTGNSLLLN